MSDGTFILDLSTTESMHDYCKFAKDNTEYLIIKDMRSADMANVFSKVLFRTPFGIFDFPFEMNTNVQTASLVLPREMDSYCSVFQCSIEDCSIDLDVTIKESNITVHSVLLIQGSEVVLNNSNVIIGNQSMMIVDNGVIQIQSSNLTYYVDSKDMFDSIFEGQRVIIIDTINNGTIQGGFEAVELESSIQDECKSISADLEESDKQVALVFKVERTCVSFPIWGIVLIVVGVVIVVTIVVVIVMLKNNVVFKRT